MYFRNPYSHESSQFIDLCGYHYDNLTSETTERIRALQMKLSNMISENARLQKIGRDNGVYHRNDALKLKIDDMRALIKKLTINECKNYFCNADLHKLENKVKLYSLHTFKPSGRRHYTFYYCSLKCFNIIRARCGIKVPIQQGQMILIG